MTAFNILKRMIGRKRMTGARVSAAIAGTALGVLVLAAAVGGTAANAGSAKTSSVHIINSTPRSMVMVASKSCLDLPKSRETSWTLHPNSPGPAINVRHAITGDGCSNAMLVLRFRVKNRYNGFWTFEAVISVEMDGVLDRFDLAYPDRRFLIKVITKCESGCRKSDRSFFGHDSATVTSHTMHNLVLTGKFDGQYNRYTLTILSLY